MAQRPCFPPENDSSQVGACQALRTQNKGAIFHRHAVRFLPALSYQEGAGMLKIARLSRKRQSLSSLASCWTGSIPEDPQRCQQEVRKEPISWQEVDPR